MCACVCVCVCVRACVRVRGTCGVYNLLLLDEDAKSRRLAKQRQLQAKWQTKRKPMAMEGSDITEGMELGDSESAVTEGGEAWGGEGWGLGGTQDWGGHWWGCDRERKLDKEW